MNELLIMSIIFTTMLFTTSYMWYRSAKQADKQILELQNALSFNASLTHEEQMKWYNEGIKSRDDDIERILRGFTGILTTGEIALLKSLLDAPLVKE